jgi:hypothetical protein
VPEGDHEHQGERRTVRHYVDDFFRNLGGYEGPLGRKVWLTVKNRSRAFAPPFRGCCGHPGEPGC